MKQPRILPGPYVDQLREVQDHVPVQPWSYSGNKPQPVEIYFDGHRDEPWVVKFVVGLTFTGNRRRWATTTGRSLTEALYEARRIQLADGGS